MDCLVAAMITKSAVWLILTVLDKCLVCQVKHRLLYRGVYRPLYQLRLKEDFSYLFRNILANPSVHHDFRGHVNRIRICHKFVHVTEIHMYVNQERQTTVLGTRCRNSFVYNLIYELKNRR